MDANPTPLSTDANSIAVRSIHIMANGSRTDFDAVIHPQAVDRENTVQPPSSRVAGPAGFYATALWLRAAVDTAFPPTRKAFAATQSHWFRIEGGKVIEHWANRDDLGQARQLGWVPPTPAYLIRMARAKGQARRAS